MWCLKNPDLRGNQDVFRVGIGIGVVVVLLIILVIMIKLIHKCYKMCTEDDKEEVKNSGIF